MALDYTETAALKSAKRGKKMGAASPRPAGSPRIFGIGVRKGRARGAKLSRRTPSSAKIGGY